MPDRPENNLWQARCRPSSERLDQGKSVAERTLAEIAAHPAVSAEGGDLRPVTERPEKSMRDCGLESRVMPTAGVPIVFGKRKESDRSRRFRCTAITTSNRWNRDRSRH
ncbi:hypothetical protein [Sphaerimonospora mesophila]|uniref:hypothetical protein n=1 Tax=Sphaerimonospora mesophila TaxID=37483 RepID=UPI000ADC71B0